MGTTDRNIVYSVGMVCCSVCVPKDWTRKQIEKQTNIEQPTGISGKWAISKDKKFKTGARMPRECEADPTRLHWLLNC